MTTKTANPFGLEFEPKDGREADAYAVASTVVYLHQNRLPGEGGYSIARHATALHVISGKLHRMAERQCNEDLTCPYCDGDGERDGSKGANHEGRKGTLVAGRCSACAGRGLTTGRREARLEAAAREIAAHYGLACYFQGDPRGCSLYIGQDLNGSNYNRGHAVARLGR